MRTVFAIILLVFSVSAYAQTTLQSNSYTDSLQQRSFKPEDHLKMGATDKKWFISKYAGLSSSFTFFKGGNATILSVPVGIQLNRRLNNNWYAFANLSAAPASISFTRSFMYSSNKFGQNNNMFGGKRFDMPTSASLGLMYINDQKTFSISGSIGVERSSYPFMPFNQPSRNVGIAPFNY
jgi:hypothetical protein